MARVIWRGARVVRDIEAKMQDRAEKVGRMLVAEIKRDMATTPLSADTRGVLRSMPGNPPAIQTGDLARSVDYTVGKRQVTIVARAPYALYLEMGFRSRGGKFVRRPFLGPAMIRNSEKIKQIILKG